MPFVEVYSQAGSVSEDRKSRIAERLVAEVMRAEGAPDNEQVRSISWLVWHEPTLWSIGGRPVGAGDSPRYVVRVTVPAPALDDAKRAEIVRAVTQVLAEADDDPERLLTSLDSFVLLNEVPDGDWGSLGQVFRFADIASYALTGAPGQLNDDEVRDALSIDRTGTAEPAVPAT